MSTKVDLSDKSVLDAIDKIVVQSQCTENENPWLLLTHVGQTNKIKLVETGDSFNDFLDELNDGRIMYGLMKFNIHGVYKIAFISWCPDGVDGITKGKFGVWNKDMEYNLKGKYHTQVLARQEEDIDRSQMIKTFKVATGSSYATTGVKVNERNTVNTAKQSISVQQEQLKSGATVQRTVNDYQDEQLKKQSEQFWTRQHEQESSSAATTTTTATTVPKSELEKIKQQSNQFWSQQQQQQQQEQQQSSSSSTSSVRDELANIKQQSNQFWSKQQEQSSTTTATTTTTSSAAPSIKADVSALRNKFAQQAQVSSQSSSSSSSNRPTVSSSSGVSSLRDRFAQQQQQEEQEQEKPSNSRLPPPPSFAAQQQQYQEEEEEEQQQPQEEQVVLPPVPTMTPPNMIPPNMMSHHHHHEEDEEDDGFDEPEPASNYQLPPPPQVPQQEQEETSGSGEQGLKYRAMYDFETDDKEELSFFEEDVLIVLENNGDWWSAYRQADISKRVGLVPANYLEPL